MTARRTSRIFLGALALLVAGACSDSTGPDFGDTFFESQGEDLAEWAFDDLYDLARQLDFGSPVSANGPAATAVRTFRRPDGRSRKAPRFTLGSAAVLSAELRAAAAGCSIESSGNDGDPWTPLDANDNDIPDDYSLSYICTDSDTSADSTVWTERYESHVRVKERSGVLHGYDAENRWIDRDEGSNGSRFIDESGYVEHLAITASTATFGATYAGRWHGRDLGESWDERWGSEQAARLEPAETIVLGERIPDGELFVTGRVYTAYEGEPAVSFTLKSGGPMLYSALCAEEEGQPFVGGTFRGALGGNEAKGFLFTINSCGDVPGLDIFGADEGGEIEK